MGRIISNPSHSDRESLTNGIKNRVVFLDMPSPWEAIPHVPMTYKYGGIGRFCTFLPCIEQVHKCTVALESYGFRDIKTFECLLRPTDVKLIEIPVLSKKLSTSSTDEDKSLLSCQSSSMDNVEQQTLKRPKSELSLEINDDTRQYCTARVLREIRGHTGYLTFATYFVPEINPR